MPSELSMTARMSLGGFIFRFLLVALLGDVESVASRVDFYGEALRSAAFAVTSQLCSVSA